MSRFRDAFLGRDKGRASTVGSALNNYGQLELLGTFTPTEPPAAEQPAQLQQELPWELRNAD